MGTDSGRHFPHGAMVDEMAALVEAGMSNDQVLHAATASNAQLCGLADSVGRLRPRMAADLLVLDDDPRRDLTVLRQPRLVMQAGRAYDPRREQM